VLFVSMAWRAGREGNGGNSVMLSGSAVMMDGVRGMVAVE